MHTFSGLKQYIVVILPFRGSGILKFRLWLGCIPSRGSRGESLSLLSPAPRGHLHCLAGGPFLRLQSRQQSIFKSLSLPPLPIFPSLLVSLSLPPSPRVLLPASLHLCFPCLISALTLPFLPPFYEDPVITSGPHSNPGCSLHFKSLNFITPLGIRDMDIFEGPFFC